MNLVSICQAAVIIGLPLATSLAAYADCNANITAYNPDSVYIDHGDGTVTDLRTNLMWKQCSEGQTSINTPCDTGSMETYSWRVALRHTATLNSSGGFSGYTDWRLPNKNELATLLERKCWSPAINRSLFPNTAIWGYWSSSSYAYDSNDAWSVNFGHGNVWFSYKPLEKRVRLVRVGQ